MNIEANKRVAKQIAQNLIHMFVGYYFEKPSSEVAKPDLDIVAKVVLPELASAGRPRYEVIGNTIFESGSTLVVYEATSEKLAQEICTAFNTYG